MIILFYLFITILMFDLQFYNVILYNMSYYYTSKSIYNNIKYDYGSLKITSSLNRLLYINTNINEYMNDYLRYFLTNMM